MAQVVSVAKERGDQTLKLPVENDGSLLYSTLVKFFPNARGLLYYTEMDTVRGVHFSRGKFYPPGKKWTDMVFYCAFLEENVMYVAEKEGGRIMELPLESDRSLLYSTLVKFFPKARGLMHYTPMNTVQGVQLVRGKFFPNFENVGSTLFYCAFLEESRDCVGDSDGNNSNEEYECSITHTKDPESANNERKQSGKDELYSDYQTTMKNNETCDGERFVVVKDAAKKRAQQCQMTLSRARPHQCDICGFCFTKRYHMVCHRRIHTGEKPFHCSACTQKFARTDSLKVHFLRHHTTAEPVEESPSTAILQSEGVKRVGI